MKMKLFNIAHKVLLVVIISLNAWATSSMPYNDTSDSMVSVAAPSDLKFALEELISVFHQNNPKVTIKVTYGSSGILYSQLTHKAPFDIFLSADKSYQKN